MLARALLFLASLLVIASAGAQTQHPEIPNTVPTKFINGQWLILASVDGNENWYVLSTEAKSSVLVGPGTTVRTRDVKISGADAGNIAFKQAPLPEVKALGAVGVIGRDVLVHLNLAVDVEEATVLVWVEQPTVFHEVGWVILSAAFSNDSQHAARLSIWDTDRAPYCIDGQAGGRDGRIELGIGCPSTIGETAVGTDNALELLGESKTTDVIDGLMISDIGPFWAVARPVPVSDLPSNKSKQIASLPIERFPARRFVFDGPSGLIVTEELGIHARNALSLSHLLGLPLEFDDNVIVGRAAGALYGDAAKTFAGAIIVTIAGHTAEEIISTLNGPVGPRMALLANFASARAGGIQVRYMRDGKPYETVLKAK